MEAYPAASVLDQVRRIVASETGLSVEEIQPSATFVSLVTDSLEMLNLIMELEGAFSVPLEGDALQKIFTVEDVAMFIEAHRQ